MRDIEHELGATECYFTNLIKCLPLKDGKIRYPTQTELETCFGNYELELETLEPKKIVLLGKQVSGFVAGKLGLKFVAKSECELHGQVAHADGVEFLSTYHPSYVLVYRRRRLDEYKAGIASFVAGSRPQATRAARPICRVPVAGANWAAASWCAAQVRA